MNPNMVFVRNSLKAAKTSVKTHESWRLFTETEKMPEKDKEAEKVILLRTFEHSLLRFATLEEKDLERPKKKKRLDSGRSSIEDTVGAVASKANILQSMIIVFTVIKLSFLLSGGHLFLIQKVDPWLR